MNLSQDNQIVYPGTFIANLSNVGSVIDFHQANKRVCDTLPSHLQDLFARSTVHLKTKKDYALKNFLIEYADVFAKSDTDLGRTSIVKHARC